MPYPVSHQNSAAQGPPQTSPPSPLAFPAFQIVKHLVRSFCSVQSLTLRVQNLFSVSGTSNQLLHLGTCYTFPVLLNIPTTFQSFQYVQSSARYLLHLTHQTACSNHWASNSVSALLARSVKHQVSVTSSSWNSLFRPLSIQQCFRHVQSSIRYLWHLPHQTACSDHWTNQQVFILFCMSD